MSSVGVWWVDGLRDLRRRGEGDDGGGVRVACGRRSNGRRNNGRVGERHRSGYKEGGGSAEAGLTLIRAQCPWLLSIHDTVLLTGSITGQLMALPAGGSTSRRWVSGEVGRASSRSADGISVTAEDDITAEAVVGVGLRTVDGNIFSGNLAGLGTSHSHGSRKDNGGSLHSGGVANAWHEACDQSLEER